MNNKKYLSVADTAKLVRTALKNAFPGVKFSVRSKSYSMGASIDVEWTDGPTPSEVKAITSPFEGSTFDGMTNLKSYHDSIHPVTGETVHFGADSVHEIRNRSVTFEKYIADAVADYFNVEAPTIDGERVKYPSIANVYAHYDLSTLVWQATNCFNGRAEYIAHSGQPGWIEAIVERVKPIGGTGSKNGQSLTLEAQDGAWLITGNTYPHRRELRAAGCRWEKDSQAWRYTGDALPESIAVLVEASQIVTDDTASNAPSVLPAKFRKLADGLQSKIDFHSAERLENTARRANMAAGQRAKAKQLERLQTALRTLADLWEGDTVPAILRGITDRNQVDYLLTYSQFPRREEDVKPLRRANITNAAAYDQARTALLRLVEKPAAVTEAEQQAEALHQKELAAARMPIPGFFPTPPEIVAQMLDLADIQPYMQVLEPSAGHGAIADAIRQQCPEAALEVVEINATLRDILKAKGHTLVSADFTEHDGVYDRIVMNPPFENGQDVTHIRRAYDQLRPGGVLVAIAGEGAFFRSTRRDTDFQAWLETVGAHIEKLPDGAFAKGLRPTQVAARLVVVRKPITGWQTPTKHTLHRLVAALEEC